jgi:hypothetical protein
MAHFAEIDENNIVKRVLVVDNSKEHRGQEFLAEDMGLEGRWIQTSYNNNFRKQFAGIGFTYDEVNDVFIAPKPYPSWILNSNFDWEAPVPYPKDGKYYYWDEDTLSWVEYEIEE